jgi:hypothetical protein
MTEPTSSSAPQAGGDETPVALTDEQAHAIHSHPLVRDCLLRYVDRPCDSEAADVVRVIYNAANGIMLGVTRPTPAAAAGVPSETAWLVEYSGKMLAALGLKGMNAGEAIQYLAVRNKGYGAGELMLHADPNLALRFARKQDAEAALTLYAGASDQSVAWIGNYLSAQEHMWPAASPVAPAGVPTCYQVTEQHPENKAFWDGVRWAQDGAVLSAGAPAVPLQDEQDSSSVHLADNGSSRALRAASQESPRPEMKLCPFCGYAQCGVIPDADEDGPMYHGYCAACDTEGPVVYSTAIKMAAEADAIAAWNRRPIRCDGRDGVTGSAASSEAAEGTSSSSGTDGHGKDCA